MFLRVNLQFPIMEVKASPKPSQMEAKGIVLSQLRCPVTVPRKAVAPLRRSNTKARGDEQKSSQTWRTHPDEGLNGAQPNGLGKWSWLSKSVFLPALCSPAAGGKILVALRSPRPGRPDYSFVSVLTSRIAGYVINVCPVVWEGRPVRVAPIPIALLFA